MALNLVTGGSGFAGGAIVKALIARGENVRVLDVLDSRDRPEGVEFIKGSVVDGEAVQKAVAGVDHVYHNVALVPLTKAGSHFWEVNVGGTQTMLDAAKDQKVKMFVHLSSTAVYGGILDRCPVTEAMSAVPAEAYGRSKLAGEQRVLKALEDGLPCSIIRPRTLIGSGRLGIFQILFDWIRDGKNIFIIGKGDNLFQFLHVDDLAESCILSAQKQKTGIYNVGADKYSTLREDLDALISHAGTRSKIVGLPVLPTITALRFLDLVKLCPLAPWHYLTYHKPCYLDVTKAKSELGWEPKYSNVKMLSDSYDWFIENYDELKETDKRSVHRSPVKEGIIKILKNLS